VSSTLIRWKSKDLAAGKNGGDDLVLLCGGQNEHGMSGRFFQGFQEGIEGRLGLSMWTSSMI
jgi:hypothetical protein